jgi:catechol 2,3-dioxygenase-like lactoylglutathione lyase family enzyme
MFDHVGFNVSNFQRSLAFWRAALAPLGYGVVHEDEHSAMLGNSDGRIWIGALGPPASPIHVALKAKTRAQVQAFYAAAIAAGGRDNGAPGLRPNYSPDYYGAFVYDPDGHNLEAVTHAPE